MKYDTVFSLIVLVINSVLAADIEQPFTVSTSLHVSIGSVMTLSVTITVPPHHLLYADQVKVETQGPVELIPQTELMTEKKIDPFSGEEKEVLTRDVTLSYQVRKADMNPLVVTVRYQGCSRDMCFLPDAKSFILTGKGPSQLTSGTAAPATTTATQGHDQSWSKGFKVVATRVGYIRAGEASHWGHCMGSE